MLLLKEEPTTLIGRTLGEFIIHEKLGEGGYGTVYRAEQPILGREAVIKVIRNKHNSDQKLIERFKKEAKLASKLEHPYTASVYAFGAETDGLLWIAMELVNGTPLSNLLKVQGPVSLERFVPLLEKICEVVHTAHENSIVHRDIKPSNVMVIARAGRLLPKLLDFGIAKGLQQNELTNQEQNFTTNDLVNEFSENTNENTNSSTEQNDKDTNSNQAKQTQKDATGAIGSPRYMPPELWESGSNADARTDIYALGVLAFEALTGKVPFPLTGPQLMFAHMFKPIPSLGGSFPIALDEVIKKAMAKKQVDRYQTALEFAAAFREAAGMVEVKTSLPQLEELLREELLTNAPQPLAASIANLSAARNCYQARERISDILQVLAKYLGVLALACRVRIGSGSKNDSSSILDAIQKLSQQNLNEIEWLELAQELCKPFCFQRDAYPIPELITFFYEPNSDKTTNQINLFQSIIEMCQSRTVSDKEAYLQSLLSEKMLQLASLLRSLTFLSDYNLIVARKNHSEKWMGHQLKESFFVSNEALLEENKVVLANAQGDIIISLWPLVQLAAPTTTATEELFFFSGKGRSGAKFLAMPSAFELYDEDFWDWFGKNLFDAQKQTNELINQEQTPYLGLISFSTSDSQIFFGREKETQNFLNRLRNQSFLVVAGPSGAGKSSFIQAGVLPWLENSRLITLRPGAFPLTTLRSRLIKEGIEVHDLHIALKHDANALGNALRASSDIYDKAIVLVIDQFEELFTLCQDQTERELFALALSNAARSEEESIRVILTVRDDFLLKVKELPAIGERVTAGLELLSTPGKDDLIRILVEPARRAGYVFEDKQMPLEMVESVIGRPGALPLLAFTAAKLWELRDRQFKQLRRKTYDALGGVGGALASHAEEMMKDMTQHEQKLVRAAFQRLVTSEGTRAVMKRDELYQVLGQENKDVLEKLVASRLLTASEGEDSTEQIEVVHEALLSAWPRLVKWQQETAENARLRDQLQSASRQWQERGRPKGLLWRDEALTEYKLWHSRYNGKLTDVENAFAIASLNEASRAQRQRRILSSVAAIFLAITSIVFYFQNQETKEKILSLYEEQGRQALLANKPDQAVLYLTEAYSGGNNKYSLKFLLSQSLLQFNQVQPLTIGGHKNFVFHSTFSPDGKNILSASADKTAKLWEASTGKLLRSFEGHKDCVRSASFNPDASKLVTASLDGTAKVWKTATAEVLLTLSSHNASVNSAVFSNDGKLIATSSLDRTAKIWDAENGKLLFSLQDHQGSVNYVAFSSDNKKLVTASSDNTAKIWDIASAKLLVTLSGHENSVNCASFSPDNLLVVTASSDNTAKIWDAVSGKELRILKDHTSVVNSAQFSSDGRLLITSGTDRTAKIWQTENGKLMNSLKVYDFPLKWASFNNDGSRVVLASNDNTMKVCNVELEKRDATTIAELVEKTIPIRFEKDSFAPNLKAQIAVKPPTKTPTSTPTPEVPHPEKVASVPALPSELNLKTFDFLTVKLDEQGKVSEQIKKQAQYFTQELVSGPGIDMIFIPEGSFPMGQQDCGANDKEACPKREVKLSAFYMSKFEITQAQWKAIMGNNPSHFIGDENLPVEQVTWYDAMEFCERLSQKTGKFFRLPSEAEWEYAARAGTTTMFAFGNTINSEIVNYDGTFPYGKAPKSLYRKKTIPVGSLGFANGFGLYDIHGNVSEWCLDPLHENYIDAPQDGSNWIENGQLSHRMVRGGSYNNMAALCFSFNRNWNAATSKYNRYGIRLVMSASSN
ncbi:MAG: SUMF1/EgtB/PvdO family nonheme iron enzyme [Acidobacteria bacterium]|nr:SUMF1/EgtB/PvdO family nonheme iron enzyme [Acidobacteriota bacterium]